MTTSELATYTQHYNQLQGKTVKGACVARDSLNGQPIFGLEFTDGTTAWILCDPEGNGPGHLDIEAA